MSRIEVIIPCYNYARYLRASVGSALAQVGVDVRVLIIDDCSSDESADVARELCASDHRVSFIHHEVNKGHIATYNEGLNLVSSDYVVLLSADDLLTPGALFRAVDLMDRNPSVGLVYGHARTFQHEVPVKIRTKGSGWTIWSGRDWIEMMCRTGRNFIVCPEVVMRTRIQHQVGGYTAALPHSGDMEMWLRAASISDVGRINGADQACYRRHSLSMQQTVHAGLLFDLQGRLAAFKSALDRQEGRLPRTDMYLLAARKALARTAIRQVVRAIKCQVALDQPVDDYEAFARSLDPDIEFSGEWKAYERLRQAPRRWWQVAAARQIADLADRVAWRRWRRLGVHQAIQ